MVSASNGLSHSVSCDAQPEPIMKRLLPGVLLLVASTVLALFMAEVAIRLIVPQQLILIRPDMWEPADTIGWLHRRDVQTTVNTGEGPVSFFTDSAGFRVGRRGRMEGGRQILLLGDSFVEALQVNYEESVAGLLEVGLSHLLGDSVVVRNAGVGGWNPNHYLIRARSLLDDEYDLIIVALFVDNDVVDERVEYFSPRRPVARATLRWPRSLKWREIVQAWLSPLNDYLEVRSHFYVLVRSRLQVVRMRMGLMPRYFPFVLLRRHAAASFWDVTADLSKDIAGIATQSRVPILFVIIPAPYQVQSEALARLMKGFGLTPSDVDVEQPSRLLREALQERGLPVVDALPRFRNAYRAGSALYGDVDPHLTRAGHQVLASILIANSAPLLREKELSRGRLVVNQSDDE